MDSIYKLIVKSTFYSSSMLYNCEMCSGYRVPFVALDIATIFNHYGRYHRHDPNFFVRCKVNGCSASYRKLEGYRSHLRRHHKNIDMQNGDMVGCVNNDNIIEKENEMDCLNQPPSDVSDGSRSHVNIDFQKQNALFLLKTRELHQLTQAATDSLVSDTTCIVKNTVEQLQMQVKDSLDNAGIQLNDIPGLKQIFMPDSTVCNPFNGLRGKTEQTRYFRENFRLVVRFHIHDY